MTDSAPSQSTIISLLEHSAYDPAIVPQLEAYAKSQVSSPQTSPYNFDANRTLAKLYQFFPHLADEGGTTALILLLALLEFPSTDFIALGCLVPEKVQSREPCASLVRCAELLENCQFSSFWSTFRQIGTHDTDPSSALLKSAAASPANADKLRSSILTTLTLTYRTAPLSVVLSCLDLADSSALNAFMDRVPEAKKVITSVAVDEVTFVATGDNTKRSRVYKEEINFGSIANLVAAARE
eukprot:CAMPEP_0195523278 /NCGR_PEP_ID=MMETSP0794_2-20130614/22259_1 /TAXON_ID=515487 /ORGANISM="Stephanopyxis turris, Strain CCMP 815" /LENGTH=239 /DNA_ID=CAMNT_0040653237 /DNA_START=112 /DNA_END=831 /DNA_ORIENTATION=+